MALTKKLNDEMDLVSQMIEETDDLQDLLREARNLFLSSFEEDAPGQTAESWEQQVKDFLSRLKEKMS